MHPQVLLNRLIDAGVTQSVIVEKTKLDQSVISRIGNGKIKNPSWGYAEQINRLYQHVVVAGEPLESYNNTNQQQELTA